MFSPRLLRRTGLAASAALALVLAACSEADVNAPAKSAPQFDHTIGEDSILHTFWICKEGTDATFKVDTVRSGTTNTGSFQVSVAEGTCVKAVRSPDHRLTVTATELAAPNVQLDSITMDVHLLNHATTHTKVTGTNTITGEIHGDQGVVAEFFNEPLSPVLELTKVADAATVPAGSNIGFTLTVSNTGSGTAEGVTLVDNLPAGTGVSWSINPANAACSIAANVLSCTFGDIAAGGSASVHVQSPTTTASCKQYPNTGSASATNHATVTASDTVTVECPSLSITKVADAASVTAGSNIGFTVTVNSNGPATAVNVVLSDALPTGTGISWSINPSVTGCSIASNTLTCNFGDLASGASRSVHVESPTTTQSCGAYPNTASASADNHGTVTASATTSVTGCVSFGDETATGAGFPWKATQGAPNNWFMYTPWVTTSGFRGISTAAGGGQAAGTDLIAGQFYVAGRITGTRGATTSITITLNSGFRFDDSSGNVKIYPMSCTAAQPYVQPGKFTVKATASQAAGSITVTGLANTACYGIHVGVERQLP